MPERYLTLKPARSTAWKQLAGLGLVIGLERRVLAIILSYAVAIGLFSLIVPLTVPLTVQELINTFAYAIEPIMIVTLALTVLVGLVSIGFFQGVPDERDGIALSTALHSHRHCHDGAPAAHQGGVLCSKLRKLFQ